MAETQLQGKSLSAAARDVADGFLFMTPLLIKRLDEGGLRALHHQMRKLQNEVRSMRCPSHDITALRARNLRLQRLHHALIILEHAAKQQRIRLA